MKSNSNAILVVGIDPGADGAMAAIDPRRRCVMLATRLRRQADDIRRESTYAALAQVLWRWRMENLVYGYVERGQMRPLK